MKFDGLCPLIFNNMHSGWSNTIYAVAASEWDLGVVRTDVEPAADSGDNILSGGDSKMLMQKILGDMF